LIAIGATLNLGFNLWMIPLWGWPGAAAATYASELIMFSTLLYAVTRGDELKRGETK